MHLPFLHPFATASAEAEGFVHAKSPERAMMAVPTCNGRDGRHLTLFSPPPRPAPHPAHSTPLLYTPYNNIATAGRQLHSGAVNDALVVPTLGSESKFIPYFTRVPSALWLDTVPVLSSANAATWSVPLLVLPFFRDLRAP
jgi:hypothetical protein